MLLCSVQQTPFFRNRMKNKKLTGQTILEHDSLVLNREG